MELDEISVVVKESNYTMMLVMTQLVGLAAFLWWWRWSQRNNFGPKTWPIVGALIEGGMNWDRIHDWMTDYLYHCHTHRMHGGFGFYYVISTNPANLEHIMKTNFNNYPKGPRLLAINGDFFGRGIFNADGDLWVHQRKVAAIEFAPIRLRTFSTQIFADYATRLAHRILDKSGLKPQTDLQELVTRMTLDTTVRIAFGVDLGSLAPALPSIAVSKSYEMASTCSFLRFLHPFWQLERKLQLGQERKLMKAVAELDAFAYAVIDRRKKELPDGQLGEQVNEEKDDLLSRFVKMSKQGDSRFGDRALRDIMVNYILAGKDSTSAAICWTIFMLTKHPDVRAKVRQELAGLQKQQPTPTPGKQEYESEEKAIEAFAALLNFDNVNSLDYLHAVLTETMRLHPPLPLNAKEALEDDILPTGQIVRKGDTIVLQAYGMARMPYLWGPDAGEFKPERWLKNGVFQTESPFKYIQFQGGPRLCLGKESSYLQMKITVAMLTQFFDFELVPGHVYHYKTMLSLIFKDGLAVTVHKRKF